MGESIVKNVDPRLGAIEWARWTNRAGNQSLVKGQLSTLLPVQELRDFQRQIREQQVNAGPSAGQQAIFNVTVPELEAWRMIDVTYEHDDSVTHILHWFYNPNRGATGEHTIARKAVNMNTATPLLRSFSEEGSASRFAPRGPNQVEFFPFDVITFLDLTSATDANVTAVLRLRWELIPLPQDKRLSTQWLGQAI